MGLRERGAPGLLFWIYWRGPEPCLSELSDCRTVVGTVGLLSDCCRTAIVGLLSEGVGLSDRVSMCDYLYACRTLSDRCRTLSDTVGLSDCRTIRLAV